MAASSLAILLRSLTPHRQFVVPDVVPICSFEMEHQSRSNTEYGDVTLAECRQLWNEFDPIGLYAGWKDEWAKHEYDRYARHSLELVTANAGHAAISRHVRSVVETSLGLKGFPSDDMDAFARRLEKLSQH